MANEVKEAVQQRGKRYEQIPPEVTREPRFTQSEFRLLLFLMSFGEDIYPSYAAITAGTGMDAATIHKALFGDSEGDYAAKVERAQKAGKEPPPRSLGLKGMNVINVNEESGKSRYDILSWKKWDLSSRDKRKNKGESLKKKKREQKKTYLEKLEKEAYARGMRDAASDAANAKHDTKQQAKIDDEWRNRELSRDDETA